MKKVIRSKKPVQTTRAKKTKARLPIRKTVVPATQEKATRKPARRRAAFETQVLPLQMRTEPAQLLTFPTLPSIPTPPAATPKHTQEDIRSLIAREAYFLAEKDGFRGDPAAYWVEAEIQVLASRESRTERVSCGG
jgi:hypothetical protein